LNVTQPTAFSHSYSYTSVSSGGASGRSITVTMSGGTSPYTYSWAKASGGALSPAYETGTPLGITLAGIPTAGVGYILTVTDHHNCMKTFPSTNAHREEPGTGLIIVGPDAIKVYPNPAKGQFNVEIPLEFSEAEIKISDMMGRVMETRIVTDNTGQALLFNLGNVPTGMYLVNVVAAGQNHVTKLIME